MRRAAAIVHRRDNRLYAKRRGGRFEGVQVIGSKRRHCRVEHHRYPGNARLDFPAVEEPIPRPWLFRGHKYLLSTNQECR